MMKNADSKEVEIQAEVYLRVEMGGPCVRQKLFVVIEKDTRHCLWSNII